MARTGLARIPDRGLRKRPACRWPSCESAANQRSERESLRPFVSYTRLMATHPGQAQGDLAVNQPELATPVRRPRSRRIARATARVPAARVTVAWTASPQDSASELGSAAFELVAELAPAPNRTWTCPERVGANWLDAISPARRSEVLLTARLDDDATVKHLVLELAELLTFRLSDSQPSIRVLFLPTAAAPHRPRHA